MKIIFPLHTPAGDIYKLFRELQFEGADNAFLELVNKQPWNGREWNGQRAITTERSGDWVEMIRGVK